MLRKIVFGVVGGAIALLIACGSETPPSNFGTSSGTNGDGGTSSGVFINDAGPEPPPLECKKMDIIFVIDNSQSMEDEQANLAKNFPEFIKVINEYKTAGGDELDYRVAIISTDDADQAFGQGRFRASRGSGDPTQSCNPGPNDKPWLDRAEGFTDPDAGAGDGGGPVEDITTYFTCRAQLGVNGTNLERPLENAKLSVTSRIKDGNNLFKGESFIREDALLALVILTDEDEGSANGGEVTPAPVKPAAEYAGDFDGVKTFRGRWAAAVIAGDRGCETPLGKAAEAVRLRQFITAVGKNGVFHSICDGDLSEALKSALTTFTNACKAFPGTVK